ncbi:MAG: ABC transporter ATP-binding protein [Candidatus Dadabacteria bacterium]|nr:MAG: ABC transporter ATP-binding protein [Candidatus Dadabacteria bacterium]
MPDDQIAISAVGLTRTFGRRSGRVHALRGVDINIQRGTVTGLVGPNGAGKSTFLKLVLGFLYPTAGTVSVFGAAAGSDEARRKIGYLPEHPSFPQYLNGREILHYIGGLIDLDPALARQRADELLAELGIAHAAGRRVRSYSKGMAQRLGIAQALMGDHELIILDEPMSGLDPVGRADVKRLLRRHKESGQTIIFCSHILEDVERLADNIIMLNRGQVAYSGPLYDLMAGQGASWQVVVRTASPPDISGVAWAKVGAQLWSAENITSAAVQQLHRAAADGACDVVELRHQRADLESLFLELAGSAQEGVQ